MPASTHASGPSLLTKLGLAIAIAGIVALAVWFRQMRAETALEVKRIEEKRPSAIAMRTAEATLRQLRGDTPLTGTDPNVASAPSQQPRWSLFPPSKPVHEQILAEFEGFVRGCQLARADEIITHKRLLYLKKAAEARGGTFTPIDTDGTNDKTSRMAVRVWKWSLSTSMSHDEFTRQFVNAFRNEAYTSSELRLALDEQLAPPSKRCVK